MKLRFCKQQNKELKLLEVHFCYLRAFLVSLFMKYDFLISGIWTGPSSDNVQHVLLHKANAFGGGWQQGKKVSKDDIIDLLKSGANIYTLRWKYTTASWHIGAKVTHIKKLKEERLETEKNAPITDAIENLTRMDCFPI